MDEERVLAFPRAPDAIELRHLRSFVAVAEELNFGRAAEQLYLSQPALSRQIRALEQFVGVELFRRSTHQVELTLAGEALLDRARSILRGVDEAVSVTQSVGGELVGRSMGMWKALADLSEAGADVHAMRDAYEALHAQFAPPPEVTVRPVSAGGVPLAARLAARPAARAASSTCTAAATCSAPRSATGIWPARSRWPPTPGRSSPTTGSLPSTRSRPPSTTR